MFSSDHRRLHLLKPEALLGCLGTLRQARRWIVAYSGGVDSHVLLHLMAQLYQLESTQEPLPSLEAIHINHQLHAESAQWAVHCEQQSALLNVPLSVHCVDVSRQHGESLEECARRVRYQCFQSVAGPGDLIVMGHHLDDQVETLLLRLLRGSGSRGMAAMPHSRRLGQAQLFRPLLDITRASIECYAIQHELRWVEDPSNNNSDFDRNFLRLQLLPQLQERWPQYRQTVARSALLSEEANALTTELAELDFHGLGLSPHSESLPLSALAELSLNRTKNLLRYWLQSRGFTLPTAAQLQAVLEQVIAAKPDADPVVKWSGSPVSDRCVEIRRFRGELYAICGLTDVNTTSRYTWNTEQPLLLSGAGELTATVVQGAGLKYHCKLAVRFRQGAERCRPSDRNSSQTLKKLFQEYNVPTWLRSRVPLIYINDTLAAVGDYWVCDGFTAANDESGLLLVWKKPHSELSSWQRE